MNVVAALAALVLLQDPLPPDAPGRVTVPVTLQQCIDLAQNHSLGLRVGEIDVQISKAQVGQALGIFDTVAFFGGQYRKDISPSASSLEGGFGNVQIIGIEQESYAFNGGFRGTLLNGATYQADANWVESERNPAPFNLINPTYDTDIGLSITQPLLRNFGTTVTKAPLTRARNLMRSAAEALDESRLQVAQQVVVAYWDYYFARRTVETRRFSVEQAERLLEITERREKVGDATSIDVVQAESELAQRRQDLLLALSDIGRTADVLKRLIYRFEDRAQWDVELIPLTEAVEAAGEPPGWAAAAGVALERRPELRRQRELLKNNDLDIVVAENAVLPLFDLNASLRFNQLADSKGEAFNFDDNFYSIGAGFLLEMPLGNRAARYTLAEARLQKIRALVVYQDTENQIVQDVRDAIREVRNSAERIEAAKEAARLALERWNAEQKRQEAGYSTTFQVRDAQEAWREAADSETRALLDYQIALANLGAAQGVLLEEYGILPSPTPRLEDRSGVHYD